MKKTACLIISLSLLLFSCAAPPSFGYQQGVSRAEFSVSFDGVDFVLSLDPAGRCVEVIKPDEIAGTKLTSDGTGYYLISEDVKMELPRELEGYISPLFDMFSLSEADAENADNGSEYTVKGPAGTYKVVLSPDGSPVSISFEGERSFTARDIRLEYSE